LKRNAEAGHVLPLVALALAALMGFGGLAADVGYWRYQERQQQSATDAAAIGGAQQLLRSTCPNSSIAQTAAQQDAADNNFSNGPNVAVAISNPPSSGAFSGDPCAVMAQITTNNVPVFLTRIFGRSFVTTTTKAVARIVNNNDNCVYLLSTSSQTNFNGASVNAPGCSIAINDTANFNGASITAPEIGYAGGTPNENGATFPMASPAKIPPVADPCPEILGCAALAAGAPPVGNCTSFNGNGFHGALPAGCYSSLNLNGATVTMSGTYELSGNSNFNGATMTGSGVTFYVPATGTAPNFNGASVSFTPPTSGPYTGVLYYQVPSNSTGPNFNGTNNDLSGLIYCPACSVNFNGARGGYLVLVFGSANFNGGTAKDFATPPAGQTLVRNVVLAQ
jgi:Putative Flp pilus-assembly TadE/G-like